MKKNKLATIMLLLSLPAVIALCTDSDEGPADLNIPSQYIKKPGMAISGVNIQRDYCLRELGGSKAEKGAFIREFYCKDGKISSKDYTCSDYNLGPCRTLTDTSACIEENDAAQNSNAVCGDKIRTDPETCDPPDALCVDKDGWPGLCSKTCVCMPHKKPKTVSQQQTTQPIIPPQPSEIKSVLEINTSGPSTEPVPETPTPLDPIQPIAFNESIGIRVSYTIASFGHAMWNWLQEIW